MFNATISAEEKKKKVKNKMKNQILSHIHTQFYYMLPRVCVYVVVCV